MAQQSVFKHAVQVTDPHGHFQTGLTSFPLSYSTPGFLMNTTLSPPALRDCTVRSWKEPHLAQLPQVQFPYAQYPRAKSQVFEGLLPMVPINDFSNTPTGAPRTNSAFPRDPCGPALANPLSRSLPWPPFLLSTSLSLPALAAVSARSHSTLRK